MKVFRRQSESNDLDHRAVVLERLAEAQRVALESLEEDHQALEADARLAFSPAAALAGLHAPGASEGSD